MICQHCGSVIPDGSRFCTECGSPVAAPAAPPAAPEPEIAPASVPAPETSFIPTSIPEPETEFIPTGVPEPATDFFSTGIPADAPSSEEAPEEILPDIPEVEIPSFDVPAPEPAADWNIPASEPEPAQSWSVPEPEPAASWSAPAPEPAQSWSAPAPEPAAPAAPAGNAFGYTEIGSGAASPRPAAPVRPAPDGAKKPITRQWWFWAAIAAVVVILVIVLIASGGKGKSKGKPAVNVSEPTTSSVSVRDSINAHKSGAPADAEPAGPMTYDEYVAYVGEYIDRRYASQGYDYYIEGEEDYDGAGNIWVEVYLWRDDTLPTAEDAYNDDPAALADWIALTNDVAEADGELYQAMLDAGLNDTIILNLVDQEDYEYLLAFTDSGEIVYDQVTEIDLWGWDEE